MFAWILVPISAVLLALSFAFQNLGILSFVSFIPFVWALDQKGQDSSLSLGFLWGLSFFLFLLWWLIPTISTYGAMLFPFSVIVVFALCSYLALYPAIWAYLFKRLSADSDDILLTCLAGAGAWIILEYIRGIFLSGFPWGSVAYSIARSPLLIQTADIWGIYGIGFFIIFFNIVTYKLAREVAFKGVKIFYEKGTLLLLSFILIVTSGFYIYGEKKLHASLKKDLTAASVQGSIDQNIKWNPRFTLFTIDRYRELTEQAKASCGGLKLVVWPETSMPFYFQDESPVKKDLLEFAKKNSFYLLLGSPSYQYDMDGRPQYLNSAYLLGPDGHIAGRYDKQHLVPFGEYLPFESITGWLRSYLPTAGNFVPGRFDGPIVSGPLKLGVMICFESIFPYISRHHVNKGANLLAVITNDAWFGKTPAPWQHADMAILRAVETRRWLIRAANTGISRIISPKGTIVAESSLFIPEYICSKLSLTNEKTLYVLFGPYWFLAISLIIVIIASVKRKNKGKEINK